MKGASKTHQTDVLICGSGSAGLMAALWLAKYGVSFRVLERRNGPLATGQADGVQCRTVEIFESFGLADQLLKESYHVLELAFYSSDKDTVLDRAEHGGHGGGIKWSHYAPDTEPGLSHMPHVILNQAQINEFITEEMLRCGGPEIDYGYEVKDVKVDAGTTADPERYPVTVTTLKDGIEEVFCAKYALGCDGAHSAVRKSLGFKMLGDSTDAIWGVTDVYPRTDFPDIRKKAVIQSTSGTLVIIPREGDEMVRFYIELPPNTIASQVTKKDIHERARLIFRPYSMEIAETHWWSAYGVGQRLADHFHEQHRVFLTGDACHTHSPKAGQGMNVSLQDGYNIGWKLGAYLTGQATESLVRTYVSERQKTAAELIEFDRNWSKIFKSNGNGQTSNGDASYVKDQFVKAGRYTAGQAYKYDSSIIVCPSEGESATEPASNGEKASQLVAGTRFPSAQVVRFSDAKVFQLLSTLQSDGRWRIIVFDGDIQQKEVQNRLDAVGSAIDLLVRESTPEGHDLDSFIEPLLVLQTERTSIKLSQLPKIFTPITGKRKLQSLHKVFVDDASYNSGHSHAFDTIGISSQRTTIVVVRPDQHISLVISDSEVNMLYSFFQNFSTRPSPAKQMIDAPLRLRRAIHANDALLVKRIIKSHPKLLHNPDTSADGLSASNLHLAASLGHLPIVKLLVSLGHEADLPALNDDFQTALMLAAGAGHTEIVHFLSEQFPSSIMRRDIRGRDAIMEASRGGHDTVLQILLTYVPCGPELAVRNADLEGNTALHFASSNGNLLVLRTLLAAGADADRRNIWSWTAVAYSATVEAEVYLKRLVTEAEAKRKLRIQTEETRKNEVLKGGVRMVGND
ncbi:hypothetical protein N0V93_008465 [Gnomoniopsis smithogilvyi]|uniref:Phenol 2-monooxygenase n=1 Tax=Gnomoniopsis smithogilvyi TaxID=1191159 RepID=A0A9W8YM15_9PEZI|nr:hypothetical protein N0V93_008465 [Gnomoniopsis smithogilvyi]